MNFGTMPWRPVVAMGDGTGGYDSPRMSGGELDRCDGHVLTRDLYGDLRYVSVFSGIEAASVAWSPLGWEPLAFSEIEPFPSAVLACRS